MSSLEVPIFKSYEEEATFWDNLDTADYMEDNGQWFQFEVPMKRAVSNLSPREYHAQREAERLRLREQLRQQQLARTREAIQRLAPKYPAIQTVYLFGSLMAEGRFTRYSDIDVAVETDDVTSESRFWRALEEALEWNFDVRPLQGAVAQAVADHGECVYARESDRSGAEHPE